MLTNCSSSQRTVLEVINLFLLGSSLLLGGLNIKKWIINKWLEIEVIRMKVSMDFRQIITHLLLRSGLLLGGSLLLRCGLLLGGLLNV